MYDTKSIVLGFGFYIRTAHFCVGYRTWRAASYSD
jgi:hypothetical protein